MSAEPAPPASRDPELHRRLQRWVAASLISPEQAHAIEELELRAALGARARTPLLTEALIYVGGSLAVSAAVALLAPRWEELAIGARTAALAVGCAVTFLIGLLARRSEDPAMARVTSVAWAATMALSGWLAGQIAADLLDLHGRVPTVAFGLGASLVGAALYAVHPRALQQAALAIGLLSLAESALGGDPRGILVGWGLGGGARGMLVAWGLGAAWALAGGLGALGVFVHALRTLAELFGDTAAMPIALLTAGAVALALALGYARRERRSLRPSPPRSPS